MLVQFGIDAEQILENTTNTTYDKHHILDAFIHQRP